MVHAQACQDSGEQHDHGIGNCDQRPEAPAVGRRGTVRGDRPPSTSPATGASSSNRHVPENGQLPRRLADNLTSLSAFPTNGMSPRSSTFCNPTGNPCANSHSVPTLAGSKANVPPMAVRRVLILLPTPPPSGWAPFDCALSPGCGPAS